MNDLSNFTGIKELAGVLNVTPRTLRFYEDQGLIEPTRISGNRVYSRRDVARVRLILRGKSLGFSIREIREFLDLYETDPQHKEQLIMLRDKVRLRIAQLEQQKIALDETLADLRQIEADTTAHLAN